MFLFTEGGICSCIGSLPTPEHITPDDEDVLQEENAVKKQVGEGVADPNVSVQIRGLVKTYPGTTKIGCCKCRKTSPYHAIKVKNSSQLHFLGHIMLLVHSLLFLFFCQHPFLYCNVVLLLTPWSKNLLFSGSCGRIFSYVNQIVFMAVIRGPEIRI